MLGLAAIALGAQQVAAPQEVPGGYGEFLLTSLLVLVAVCVLAWVVLKFGLRRLYPGARPGAGGPIEVLARLPLEPRQTLYIVRVAGKTLLVGSGDRPVNVIAELDADAVTEAIAAAPKGPRSFAEVLRRITGREPPVEQGEAAGQGEKGAP